MTARKAEADLRVYGWNLDGRRRAICAAKSLAAVVRAVNATGRHESYRQIRFWGSWTGNAAEIVAANAQPGVVLVASMDDHTGTLTPLRARVAELGEGK